jgi:DNA-binding NtrC family response regulator
MESELFGHERGAFTGAETRRIGRFEQAHGGTIFLDEIGELDPTTQSKLLRVLQERSIVRLGGRENLPLDLRIVAATHLDLEAAIVARRFREDLYYRLSVVEIRVPALRDRAEDIPQLVQYFLRRYAAELGTPHLSIMPEAIAFFEQQPWPGNVRELENAVRKAILLARGQIIGLDEARATLRPPDRTAAARQPLADYIAEVLQAAEQTETGDALRQIVQTAEREACTQAMQRAGGNLTHAARWLGITRVTLREKLTALGLRANSAPDAE